MGKDDFQIGEIHPILVDFILKSVRKLPCVFFSVKWHEITKPGLTDSLLLITCGAPIRLRGSEKLFLPLHANLSQSFSALELIGFFSSLSVERLFVGIKLALEWQLSDDQKVSDKGNFHLKSIY